MISIVAIFLFLYADRCRITHGLLSLYKKHVDWRIAGLYRERERERGRESGGGGGKEDAHDFYAS